MIEILSIQDAYRTKIERQAQLKGLKLKCHGSCAYVGGDISPGCYGCFYSDALCLGFMLGRDFGLPSVCNRDCVYCFEPHEVRSDFNLPPDWKISREWKDGIKKDFWRSKLKISTPAKMQYYEISGTCEPLFYLPLLKDLTRFLREEVDTFMGAKGWIKLYSNGTLITPEILDQLQWLGLDELRIHPGASDFSAEIFEKIRLAAGKIPIVTVETPAWPPHREKLLEMLPVLDGIGVKHLNICQVEITHKKQLEKIEKALGNVRIYQAFYPVVDDGGLVEEIMSEVLEKGYRYSVLDCNGFVKQSRSAVSEQSFWTILNRKFPPEWERQRDNRQLR